MALAIAAGLAVLGAACCGPTKPARPNLPPPEYIEPDAGGWTPPASASPTPPPPPVEGPAPNPPLAIPDAG